MICGALCEEMLAAGAPLSRVLAVAAATAEGVPDTIPDRRDEHVATTSTVRSPRGIVPPSRPIHVVVA